MKRITAETYEILEDIEASLSKAVESLGEIDVEDVLRPEAACGESFVKWWRSNVVQAHDVTRQLIETQRNYDARAV